jgi:ElaB/YqjD/DUF883 family membrane-anchored ribosome-binding protein
MSASNFAHDASTDAKDQIAQLRAQVQTLLNDRVAPALSNAADKAQHYAEQARDAYEGQTEALSERVRESPLVAVLIAAGVGYLLGRIIR